MSWAGLAAPLKSNLAGKTKLQTYVSVTFCILFQPSCQCLSSIYLCMKQQFWCFTVFLASLEILWSIFIKFDFECLCYCLFTLKSYSDELRSEVTKKQLPAQIKSLKCEKKKITIKVNKTVHLPFELKVSVLQRTYPGSSHPTIKFSASIVLPLRSTKTFISMKIACESCILSECTL